MNAAERLTIPQTISKPGMAVFSFLSDSGAGSNPTSPERSSELTGSFAGLSASVSVTVFSVEAFSLPVIAKKVYPGTSAVKYRYLLSSFSRLAGICSHFLSLYLLRVIES